MKLSISLAGTKASKPVGVAPPLKKPTAFSSLDDDEPIDAAPTAVGTENSKGNSRLISQHAITSKAIRKRMEAERKVDSTVYEYDEVWDNMQQAKQRQKEAKEVDATQKKPKYIKGLLDSAATRKLDHLRAEEYMMQREREAEGDEFIDKESFVTQAYKDQMEEVRQAEEEEKKRDELLKKKKGGAPTGMAFFYQKLLQETEQEHEATVAATQKPVIGPQAPAPNLTITKPTDFTPKSDFELAKIARQQGKEVELNDDNQLVDKRELLTAGLNLSAPNTRVLGLKASTSASIDGSANSDIQAHRAVGTAASRREINQRRAKEIQQQMEEEEVRAEHHRQQKEREATARIVAKRNNEEDVQSARERYLQRKRQKVEMECQAEP